MDKNGVAKNGALLDSDEVHPDIGATKRKHLPGDVLDIIKKLRSLMSQYQTDGYILYASFDDIVTGIDEEVKRARYTCELAAARVTSLLKLLEKSPPFLEAHKKHMASRKEKRGK